jgi:tetratricopeptide (TPR) repeat protein
MRPVFIIIILLSFSKLVFGQSASKLFEKANEEFLIGNYTNAIHYCKLSIEKDSSLKEVNFIAALAFYNLKDTLKAVIFFNKEIKINKNDYRSYLYKSKLTIKNYNSANNDLSTAITMNPDNFLLYLEKGNLNYYHHKYTDAIESYNKAILLKPNLSDAFYNLGFCEFNLKDTTNACKYWGNVEELDDYKEYELIQKICTKQKRK